MAHGTNRRVLVATAAIVAVLTVGSPERLALHGGWSARLSAERSAIAAADGWRALFDGKTTAGWRGFRQQTLPAGWQAVGGALTRVGQGAGDIVTVDEFGDFELTLEWNLSPNGN